MKLEKIITLASMPVRLRLLAMVRSLRAVGCELPVLVIPYTDDPVERFPLPEGCEWWERTDVLAWLTRMGAHPATRKYQCFLTGNYQFADPDVVFLRNPETVLLPIDGFVASCVRWRDPGDARTPQSEAIFRRRSTNWQKEVFNAGQFACDRPLFADFAALHRAVHAPKHLETCLSPVGEQPGANLLRLLSGAALTSLTLPPHHMESTWAGDYPDEGFEAHWSDEQRRPYLIHWEGVSMRAARPIHELFYRYLTSTERDEWHAQLQAGAAEEQGGLQPHLQRAKRRALRVWDALVDG